ncbi:MAG: hypothetical protein L6435_01375 [Anaerolineae bacterium]|nr:hypothetical protein [Anaerolineae bacterium]
MGEGLLTEVAVGGPPEAEAVGLRRRSPAGWKTTDHGGTEYTKRALSRTPHIFSARSVRLGLGTVTLQYGQRAGVQQKDAEAHPHTVHEGASASLVLID